MASLKELGGYRVIRKLGAGGVAIVYLAKASHGGEVVLKVGSSEHAQDFVKEADILRRLVHPNVVRVLDAGRDGQRVYLVFEHVVGADLHKLLSDLRKVGERLTWGAAVLAARDVSRALVAAHASPLVHRDVTPSNVLLDNRGQVKLADFGTAKWDAGQTRTRTGVIRGKYEYLAPEQAQGGRVDARTDLFAVGLMLFEMWSGEVAYQAANPFELVEMAAACALPPLEQALSQLGPNARRCSSVLSKLLQSAPDDRFASAAALVEALDALIGQSEPDARRSLALLVVANSARRAGRRRVDED